MRRFTGFRYPARATEISLGTWGLLPGASAPTGTGLAPAEEAQRVAALVTACADPREASSRRTIALFYASGFSAIGVLVAATGIAASIVMQKIGARSPWAYVIPAIVIWAGAYSAGVHPTLAGVVVGLMTPVHAWYGTGRFLDVAESNVTALRANDALDEHAMLPHLDALDAARREAVSPVERLQHALHGWVAFGIMPLFALANAGVPLGEATFEGDGLRVFLGVTIGLVAGKVVGVVGFSWLARRLGLTALPAGVGWKQIGVVGLCAGIGFTMALFIAQLAFPPGPLLETAKLAILCASAIAAIGSLLVGIETLPPRVEAGAASSESEAEASTTA